MGTAPTEIGQYHAIAHNDRKQLLDLIINIQPKAIFHLAGVADIKDLTQFYEINTLFASNIIWAVKKSGCKNCPIVLTGSSAEYGLIKNTDLPIQETQSCNPYDHYGISKLAQTLMGVREARDGLPTIMVRPFNIIGPGMPNHLVLQSFVNQIKSIKQGNVPPIIDVGNLSPQRDFIDVADVVESFWNLILAPASFGEIINICSGKGISIECLLNHILSYTDLVIEKRVDPIKVKPVDVPIHFGSNHKLQQITGFSPKVDIQRSIENILRFENIL
jgi:GDP-4-dehydro-6-deoxy-D-mannose reductase